VSRGNGSRHKFASPGFTLVELLVAMVMFGILTAAGYSLLKEQRRINQTQQNLLEVQSSARAAFQVLIQSFSHAGFGCNGNISSANTVAGEDAFIHPTNQAFSGTSPDSVIIVYGYEHVATVNGAITSETNTVAFDNATNLGTTNYTKYISFYPSLSPNDFYIVSSKTTTTATLTRPIAHLRNNAKVFRVNPLQYYITSSQLRQRETQGAKDEAIAYDVQDFQLAYTAEKDNLSAATWEDNPADPEKVQAVWIYLLLRTRETEPGYQDNRTFRLPWDATQTFQGSTLPAGFHYQEFQTQVWLRNAN